MLSYLFSFFYFEKADLAALAAATERDEIKFFADSGAFSAATTGKPVNLANYAAWLRKWDQLLDPYVNLDVKYDWKEGNRNQAKLEKMGLHPTPVFHLGEPLDLLREMCDQHDFVAIGNLTTSTKKDPKLWGLLDLIHTIAADRGTGLHGFGLSSWPLIDRFPWRSVDSSSMGASFRFGVVKLFDFYSKRWTPGFRTFNDAAWHEHGWLMREYGFDPSEFRGRSRKDLIVPLLRLAGATWAKVDEVVPETDFYLVDVAMQQPQEGAPRIAHYESGVRQVRQLAAARA